MVHAPQRRRLPAYEFGLDDVESAGPRLGLLAGLQDDRRPRACATGVFLARTFHKLLINFTWWVNRKDVTGKHLFSGGFLGLDNIGVFDRSRPLPGGAVLEQADGTAWMAFYCVTMLAMALELAGEDPVYEDVASKFFEHFVAIADAMNTLGGTGLWDEEDGFYYDHLHVDGQPIRLRIRSIVGIIPLFAVEVSKRPGDRPAARIPQADAVVSRQPPRSGRAHLVPRTHGARRPRPPAAWPFPRARGSNACSATCSTRTEFLSPFGVRSLSRVHKDRPFTCSDRRPGAARSSTSPANRRLRLFGGNSNWRGPIWFPVNYLLIEALERYHHFYGDTLRVECPTGSGRLMNLQRGGPRTGQPG